MGFEVKLLEILPLRQILLPLLIICSNSLEIFLVENVLDQNEKKMDEYFTKVPDSHYWDGNPFINEMLTNFLEVKGTYTVLYNSIDTKMQCL